MKVRIQLICVICSARFEVKAYRGKIAKTCSVACRQKHNARQNSGEVQRFRGEGKSYVKLGGRHMHRVIAEQKLGRSLRPGEVVHHVDGNKRNNAPENLEVLESQSVHARKHLQSGHVMNPKRFHSPCTNCGGVYSAKGLCKKCYAAKYRKAKA